MKTLLLIIALAISTIAQATIHTITQQGTTFTPANLQVSVGDIVRWVWTSGTHTTTSQSIPANAETWDSPLTTTTNSFEYTVTVAGTYHYVCTPHESMGMVGQFTATAATNIAETPLEAKIVIYPQPALGELNVQIKREFTADELFVADILGRKVIQRPIISNSQNDLVTLDISNLHPGLFFVGFTLNNKRLFVLRFLKQ